ncbi:MAG: hypothetical protein V1743_07860 [Nanoarchaeota archaeon]
MKPVVIDDVYLEKLLSGRNNETATNALEEHLLTLGQEDIVEVYYPTKERPISFFREEFINLLCARWMTQGYALTPHDPYILKKIRQMLGSGYGVEGDDEHGYRYKNPV